MTEVSSSAQIGGMEMCTWSMGPARVFITQGHSACSVFMMRPEDLDTAESYLKHKHIGLSKVLARHCLHHEHRAGLSKVLARHCSIALYGYMPRRCDSTWLCVCSSMQNCGNYAKVCPEQGSWCTKILSAACNAMQSTGISMGKRACLSILYFCFVTCDSLRMWVAAPAQKARKKHATPGNSKVAYTKQVRDRSQTVTADGKSWQNLWLRYMTQHTAVSIHAAAANRNYCKQYCKTCLSGCPWCI